MTNKTLGPIRQVAYVVEDIEAEMDHWAGALGVGPWFYIKSVRMESYSYQGEASSPHVSIALSNSGDLQIELIQQRCDTPTSYKAFTDSGRTGQQHISHWPDDYDAALQSLLDKGYTVDQEGEINKPGRFAYLIHPSDPNRVIEISETSGPKGKFFERIADVARTWDGTEPVRRVGG